jgi:predicted peptidase
MPIRSLAAVAAVVGFAASAAAADLPPNFIQKSYANADGTMSPYVVYVPPGHDTSKPLPVILFLHGSGESKGGSTPPIGQGLMNGHFQKRAAKYPAIVVVPQCESRRTGWKADGPDGKRAVAMLDAVMAEYKCDPKRQYLTGLSMGGYGAWSLAAATPDRWAAVVPICGGGDTATADAIKNLPIWVWHGTADGAVPVKKSREMVDAITKAGGKPRYTELEFIGHNSWDSAYAAEDLFAWLFAQKQK